MTFKMTATALAAALSLAAPAWAGERHPAPQGHWEWRAAPQYGPRTTVPSQKRVWIPDQAQMAHCDCDMMAMNTADCMKSMHEGRSDPSAG
ncbi:hypothetical protein A0J57_00390 [Sphingobium sp. 22B]|nr:hypothetical protein [Sphingobium sp. 22B]KXU33082.1 hypothetical protein AXW74_04180 [Sphingobium sp. AM]KYC33918.1 hypothetical protein A0J57_00390 [Sphingobium sp. 22B]